MAWYNTGTIALTNGSATVTGSGTNFLVGAQIGEALYAPDGKLYEIQTINSATVITLASNYLGSTASGQNYQIIPTQSLVADLASDVTDLISDFADVRDYAGNGKFNDGAVGTPGITFTQDQDNGLYRIGSNNWALAAGGQKIVDISTSGINVTGAGTFSGAVTVTGNLINFNTGAGNAPYIQHTGNQLDIRGGTGSTRFLNNAGSQSTVTIRDTGNVNGSGLDVTGTVTATGNVGIGTTPIAPLHVKGTTNGNLLVRAGSLAVGTLTGTALSSINDAASATVPLTFEGSEFNFVQSNAVKVKVDSSGNLLVGRTSSSGLDVDGHVLFEGGGSYISNTDSGVQFVNRNGVGDGALTSYYKNGVAIGSIGTKSGDMYVGTGNTTLRFNNADDAIYAGGGDGSGTNAGTDLGSALYNFGDLYLSGGVVFGTTGGSVSSKTLDDYEEGTWTPITLGSTTAGTGTYGFQHGSYTKVGNLVTVNIYVDTAAHTGTGSLRVGGSRSRYKVAVINMRQYSFGECHATKALILVFQEHTSTTTTISSFNQIATGTTEASTAICRWMVLLDSFLQ